MDSGPVKELFFIGKYFWYFPMPFSICLLFHSHRNCQSAIATDHSMHAAESYTSNIAAMGLGKHCPHKRPLYTSPNCKPLNWSNDHVVTCQKMPLVLCLFIRDSFKISAWEDMSILIYPLKYVYKYLSKKWHGRTRHCNNLWMPSSLLWPSHLPYSFLETVHPFIFVFHRKKHKISQACCLQDCLSAVEIHKCLGSQSQDLPAKFHSEEFSTEKKIHF